MHATSCADICPPPPQSASPPPQSASSPQEASSPCLLCCRQGEQGDNFYVIAEGTFTARIAQPGDHENVVFTYESRGAFGELALMYNCPRAATVQVVLNAHSSQWEQALLSVACSMVSMLGKKSLLLPKSHRAVWT